ncbi:lipid A-modifier LpxR family protein [Aliiroseovarius subalbicans]|uniref:lipid A-modifier LpxR family protein n=1 Tax=Aliiroseovarius subalbicans TaxID=2925840 RepID=UPI001F56DAFC|nr:lipid A-modifier LpxR family protein [Aliiroseovarius subalbicans]MCI2400594.1 lipid A deacylase LpxR family protein [Aliiroseovarius subalbicans]
MRPFLLAVVALLSLLAAPVNAGDKVTLGFGGIFNNDFFGDNQDRWRTGAYVVNWMRGPEGTTARGGIGDVWEIRFGSAIIAPANLVNPAPGDRRWVGMLSVGLHSHAEIGGTELSAGIDLVATGPQTGLASFQDTAHDILGMTPPSPAVIANQIPNAFHPTALIEAGRPLTLSDNVTLRPFLEAQGGVETFVRAGGDLLVGSGFTSGILVRDVTTGQLYQGAGRSSDTGLSLLLGGDVAHVWDSAYLPAADGYQLTDARARARAGLYWQGKKASIFYGVTWLGREFQAQPEGQVLGSLNLQLDF